MTVSVVRLRFAVDLVAGTQRCTHGWTGWWSARSWKKHQASRPWWVQSLVMTQTAHTMCPLVSQATLHCVRGEARTQHSIGDPSRGLWHRDLHSSAQTRDAHTPRGGSIIQRTTRSSSRHLARRLRRSSRLRRSLCSLTCGSRTRLCPAHARSGWKISPSHPQLVFLRVC